MSLQLLATSASGAFIAYFTFTQVRNVLRTYSQLRGSPCLQPTLYSPSSPFVLVKPAFPPGSVGDPNAHYSAYTRAGCSIIAVLPVIDIRHGPHFFVADPEAVKVVSMDRFTYQKDVDMYKLILFYGKNVVGTEGADWKRHRDVAKPAFAGSTELVWRITCDMLRSWFEDLDAKLADASDTEVEVVGTMTRITLLVISAAGFGRRLTWSEDASADTLPPPEGYSMSFRTALVTAVDMIILKVLLPPIVSSLHLPFVSKLAKHANESYQQLGQHIQDMISDARATTERGMNEERGGRKKSVKEIENTEEAEAAGSSDLLKRLVSANGEAEGEKLSDDELVSNVYVFLLAGHETSTHSLSFALALLSLYPEVQEKVHAEAMRLYSEGDWAKEDGKSYKEDYPKLEYTLAVIRETMRLFPLVVRLPKLAKADSTLPMMAHGQKTSVFVPKGSYLILDVMAVHTHPKHWGPDADEFKPERFIDTPGYSWPREAYLPFALGPRSCMGARFALTELVCLLSHVIRRYRIEPSEDIMRLPTHEERYARMMRWKMGVTSTPIDIRVRFSKR